MRAITSTGPLGAMCGRLRVGKSFLHVSSIGRCSHVWTAPSWQELSSRKQHWSVQPCVDGSELARAFFTEAALVGAAMCGRLRVGKSFLHVSSIGRCSHVWTAP